MSTEAILLIILIALFLIAFSIVIIWIKFTEYNADQITRQAHENFNDFAQNLKTRDYLIKTKFHGKLKNEKLIAEFDKYILNENIYINSFGEFSKNMKQEILDYNFKRIEKFLSQLERYELRQEMLEKYCTKEKTTTNKNYKTKNIGR